MQVLAPRPPARNAVRSEGLGAVGVVAPLGRDARLIADRLRSVGLRAQDCPDVATLCDGFEAGRFDTLVLTTESVSDPVAAQLLRDVLQAQPSWSDVPVLILSATGHTVRDDGRLLLHLGARPTLTVLERPVPASVLVATVRLALLARARQLEIRSMLGELERANARLEARVEERTKEVRRLAADLTLAEHTERRRIAYLLHDDLQQRLHGLAVSLALATRASSEGDAERASQMLAQSEKILEGASSLTRSLSHELAPPLLKGGGIVELLEWMASTAKKRFGLEVDIEVDDGVLVSREDIRVLLSQILGELLFNVAKHAGVDRVRMGAHEVPGLPMVRIVVEDEGKGFDTSQLARGAGLLSVRERAELVGGRLSVESSPGAGTCATLEMPSGAGEGHR